MITYIVRRVIAAIALLFVVSFIIFSIFYLVPRLAGATPETLATRYVGRAADRGHRRRSPPRGSGSTTRIYVQYGNWAKGLVAGAEYDMGSGRSSTARRPCLGYSFLDPAGGLSRARSTGRRSPSPSPSAPP